MRNLALGIVALALASFVGCGSEDDTGDGTSTGGTAGATGGAAGSSSGGSGGAAGAGGTATGGTGGSGCGLTGNNRPFGACCTDNAQCTSNLCFAFGDGTKACTQTCIADAECPAGSQGKKCNNQNVCRP